jgi:acyl carrier protein
MSDVTDRVKRIVAEHLDIEGARVDLGASFIDDLGADSLDAIELLMAFEEDFSIEIPENAVETIITVKDAVDYIEKQLAA